MLIRFTALLIAAIAITANCAARPDNCTKYYESKEWLFSESISVEVSAGYIDQIASLGITAAKVFSGDSLIMNWALLGPENGGYNWTTPALITDTVNTAIWGNTTCDLITRHQKHISSFMPQMIFIDGGGNDFKFNVENKIIMQNLNELLTMIRTENPDARIVYGAIPPTLVPYANINKGEINNYVASVVIPSIGNACFLELQDFLAVGGVDGMPVKNEYSLDGVHFKPQVYIVYKARVEEAFAAGADTLLNPYLTCSNLKPLPPVN